MGNKKGRVRRKAKANNWKAMLNKKKMHDNTIELDVSLRFRLTRQENCNQIQFNLSLFFEFQFLPRISQNTIFRIF